MLSRRSHYHIQSHSIAFDWSPTKIIIENEKRFFSAHLMFRIQSSVLVFGPICALWHCMRVAGVTNRLIKLLWFLCVVVFFHRRSHMNESFMCVFQFMLATAHLFPTKIWLSNNISVHLSFICHSTHVLRCVNEWNTVRCCKAVDFHACFIAFGMHV